MTQRSRVLLHAAEQRGQPLQLRVAGETATELDAAGLTDRAFRERTPPAFGLVGGIVERLRDAERLDLEAFFRLVGT